MELMSEKRRREPLPHAELVPRFELETLRSRALGYPVATLYADIGLLARINQTTSRVFGNYVLRKVGQRLVASVRPYDLVFRGRDDEFFAILLATNQAEANRIATRVKHRVEGLAVQFMSWITEVALEVQVISSSEPENKFLWDVSVPSSGPQRNLRRTPKLVLEFGSP